MEEVLALAQKISQVSFPVSVVIILIGSYFGKWVWGKELERQRQEHEKDFETQRLDFEKDIETIRKDYEARLTELRDARTKWESIAIRASGLAENVVAIATPKAGGSRL